MKIPSLKKLLPSFLQRSPEKMDSRSCGQDQPADEKLQGEIERYKSSLSEQDAVLARFLSDAFLSGTVLKIVGGPDAIDWEKGDLCDVIDPASPHYRQSGRVGEDVKKDSVEVKLLCGDFRRFRPDQLRSVNKGVTNGVWVIVHGQAMFVKYPANFEIKEGDAVKLSSKTFQIVAASDRVGVGPVGRVVAVLENGMVEITSEGHTRIVHTTVSDLETGNSVILDRDSTIILQRINGNEQFRPKDTISTVWTDIVGCTEAKAALRDIVETPHKHPEIYAQFGMRPPAGVLIYGPPGCGKTMLARAAYRALAESTGKDAVASGFMSVKGPEILSKFVGVAEEQLRGLFHQGNSHYARYGFPAVLFIDEAEALFRKRGSGISSDVTDNLVTTFCAEMDGMDKSRLIVILATNMPSSIDGAVIREGRCDHHIRIPRPNESHVAELFEMYLKRYPTSGKSPEELSTFAASELLGTNYSLLNVQSQDKGSFAFTLSDAASGAMIEAITRNSCERAMHRQIQAQTAGTATDQFGITSGDIMYGIRKAFDANKSRSQDLNLMDFCEQKKIDFKTIKVETVF